jgi:hypothetical protein
MLLERRDTLIKAIESGDRIYANTAASWRMEMVVLLMDGKLYVKKYPWRSLH